MPALFGGYQLLTRLGAGGMAEVFLAQELASGERVALKRILPHLADRPELRELFLTEARLAARLHHPHIVRVHDLGWGDAEPFLVMEHVAGVDLAALEARARAVGDPIGLAELAALLESACAALDHAHELGIVHRDVTPSNLLLSFEGVLKLADFGIAGAAPPRFRSDLPLPGKRGYISPEQERGAPVDRRSDIWSLGVCAWKLATGTRPPEARRRLPAALEAIFARALSRDPKERWPTARAFGEALAGWLASVRMRPTAARLKAYLGRLFGAEAAAGARLLEPPREPTLPQSALVRV